MANEKRLIDANALEFEPDENCIANGVLIWGGRTGGKIMTTVLAALKKMIANAPTVDAVEVVRCKDCAKSVPHEIFPHSRRCKVEDCRLSHKETHYCSYGERRTE